MSIYRLDPASSVSCKAGAPLAHENIGIAYYLIEAALQKDNLAEASPHLMQLGMIEGSGVITALFKSILLTPVELIPSPVGGVMHVIDQATKEPCATFKIGRRRANYEIAAAKLAHFLGLQDSIVEGVFCAVKDPIIKKSSSPDAAVLEELFIDPTLSKLFELHKKPGKSSRYVVGIIEPFLNPTPIDPPSNELLMFAKMTILALVIGLRDGKSDGHMQYRLFDNQECMPTRLDPADSDRTQVPATDLPFLETPLSECILPEEVIASLKALVEKWDFMRFLTLLHSFEIQYADKMTEEVAKTFLRSDETGGPELVDEAADSWDYDGSYEEKCDDMTAVFVDEGTCKYTFSFESTSPSKGGYLSPFKDLASTPLDQKRLFNDAQIEACMYRLDRIKSFFETKANARAAVTILDLVGTVDPTWKKSFDAVRTTPKLERFSPCSIAGKVGSPLHSPTPHWSSAGEV